MTSFVSCVLDGADCCIPAQQPQRPPHAMMGPMKSYRNELWFEVATRWAFVNITPETHAIRQQGRG